MTSLIQGQVTKGSGIYNILPGLRDTCFKVNFAFEIRWRDSFAHKDPFRQSSGQGQVKRGQILKLIFCNKNTFI